MSISALIAGDSPVHRLPATAKLVGLFALGAVALAGAEPGALAAAVLILAGIARLAGFPISWLVRQLRPLVLILASIMAFHLVNGSPRLGLVSVLGVSLAVLAAGLVTATTRMSDMVDAFATLLGPFRVIGIAPERIAMMMSLGLRFVPSVLDDLHGLQDARRARGAGGPSFSLLVPLLISNLRKAEELADAMEARGYGSSDGASTRRGERP